MCRLEIQFSMRGDIDGVVGMCVFHLPTFCLTLNNRIAINQVLLSSEAIKSQLKHSKWILQIET